MLGSPAMTDSPTDKTRRPRATSTVLVVEAHTAQRESLGRLLRAEGHTVLEASSADAGLDLLRHGAQQGTEVSLVVVGEGPLGRTGARMLQGMSRVDTAGTPAVVLTASDSYGDTAGLTFGLRKPFQVEELLAVVSTFRQRRRPD